MTTSEQAARDALGDARPHWFNKQGEDCGPLPFTPDEITALDALTAAIEERVRREKVNRAAVAPWCFMYGCDLQRIIAEEAKEKAEC